MTDVLRLRVMSKSAIFRYITKKDVLTYSMMNMWQEKGEEYYQKRLRDVEVKIDKYKKLGIVEKTGNIVLRIELTDQPDVIWVVLVSPDFHNNFFLRNQMIPEEEFQRRITLKENYQPMTEEETWQWMIDTWDSPSIDWNIKDWPKEDKDAFYLLCQQNNRDTSPFVYTNNK